MLTCNGHRRFAQFNICTRIQEVYTIHYVKTSSVEREIHVLNTCTYNVSLFDILPLVHISNKWFRNHDACLRVQSNFEWTTNVLLEYGMPKNVQI